MNGEGDHERNLRLPKWPFVGAALYLLSMGPFWALREHGIILRGSSLERGLVALYSLIELVAQNIPVFKTMMLWYLERFIAP